MAETHPRYRKFKFPKYAFNEFPMMYYPDAKDQKRPYDDKGKPLPSVRVENQEELDRLLGGDAVVVKGRIQTPEDERLALIAEAEKIGVQVDHRWKAHRLKGEIERKRQELLGQLGAGAAAGTGAGSQEPV